MPLRLTICGLCTPSRPEVYRLVQQLRREYGGQLKVIELECMAACDDTPAVMVEHAYHARVTASVLRQLVEAQLGVREHEV